MTRSDEARSGFLTDIQSDTSTTNDLLIGHHAYGFSFRETNLSLNAFGDLDAYRLTLDIGSDYTITTQATSLFGGNSVLNTHFALLDRDGKALVISTDNGDNSSYTFRATDSIYYVSHYTDSVGYYDLSINNHSVKETAGIGESILVNTSYTSALDYSSDLDIFKLSAEAGVTYRINLTSNIPDVALEVEYAHQLVKTNVLPGNGQLEFTANNTGEYEIQFSSDSLLNLGAYTFSTEIIPTPTQPNEPGREYAASFASTRFSVEAIGFSPNGQTFLIKVGGVTQTVPTGSLLNFNGDIVSTFDLSNTLPITPVYLSSIGPNGYALPDVYTGAVSFLEYQYLGDAAGNTVSGSFNNDFLNLLGGDDAADGGAGNDVLDGGTGSNFLTGGNGEDIFFLDGRSGSITWSTITDFRNGDSVNIWGWVPGVSKQVLIEDSNGAEGFKGVTYHYDLNNDGTIDTSVTFSGLSVDTAPDSSIQSVAENGYLLFV